MENPIQDVLTQEKLIKEPPTQEPPTQGTKPNNDAPSSSTAVVTRSGKFTAYFIGKVVIVAIVIAFVIAIAAGAYFRNHLGAGILAELGFDFMAWGLATLVLVVAFGSVPYFFWKRHAHPPSRTP
jgi:hypothetical protein